MEREVIGVPFGMFLMSFLLNELQELPSWTWGKLKFKAKFSLYKNLLNVSVYELQKKDITFCKQMNKCKQKHWWVKVDITHSIEERGMKRMRIEEANTKRMKIA